MVAEPRHQVRFFLRVVELDELSQVLDAIAPRCRAELHRDQRGERTLLREVRRPGLEDEPVELGHPFEPPEHDVLGFRMSCEAKSYSVERGSELRQICRRIQEPGELGLEIRMIAAQQCRQLRRHVFEGIQSGCPDRAAWPRVQRETDPTGSLTLGCPSGAMRTGAFARLPVDRAGMLRVCSSWTATICWPP